MKKTFLSIIAALMLPAAALADGYSALWKQYEAAKKKDLPKTQLQVLDRIASLAEREKNYGNLLSAEVDRVVLTARISTDSIMPCIERMETKAKAEEGRNGALAAIYYCVAGDAYGALDGTPGYDNAKAKKEEAYAKAMQNPELLAASNALSYQPLMKKGADSRIFNNDLLSVIGYKTGQFALLNGFYDKMHNRTAALVTALEMVKADQRDSEYSANGIKAKGNRYLARLDSLISRYGDLPECGEAAMARYEYMNRCPDVSQGDKAKYLTDAMKRWSAWRNMPRLKSEYEKLIQPWFDVAVDESYLPYAVDSVRVSARNVKNVKIAVTRLNLSGNTYLNPEDSKAWGKLKPLLVASSRIEINSPVVTEHAYDSKSFFVAMPKLKPGLYIVEMSADNPSLRVCRSLISVTDLYVATLALPENKTRVAVLNATTGQPVAGAKVEVVYSNDKSATFSADSNGEVILSGRSYDLSKIRAFTAGDNFMQYTGAWGNFNSYGNNNKSSQTAVFTDRAIYRPGQVVHASAVAYDVNGLHSTKVAGGKHITFTLYNANHKVVEEKKASTDDYGTASVDFSLPEGKSLNGRFFIRCTGNGNGSRWFQVEEYKRPTYEVTFDDAAREYHNGDTVAVSGRAMTYSGVPVQGARVSYEVNRSRSRWLWWYRGGSEENMKLLSDTVTTDADGRFSVCIPVVMPEGYEENGSEGDGRVYKYVMPDYYTFTASATVTDNAGESHAAETQITLGTRATSLSFNLPEKALRDSTLSVTFRRLNASGKEIDGVVSYWFDSSSKRYTAKANEAMAIDWSRIEGIASGKHTMWAACGTDSVSQEFVLFGINDKWPATETPDWSYVSSATFPKDGKPVYVQVGSSCPDTHILYSVIAGKKVIESGSLNVSNGIVTTPYIYKEEYGEGLLLNYVWVKNGVAYAHKFTIARPMQDKSLRLKWVTFRDKLVPGQKETWTLNISRPDTKDIINKKYYDEEEKGCQLLALMYDKSLDQIARNRFSFDFSLWQNLPSTRWNTMNRMNVTYGDAKDIKWFELKPLSFNWLDYQFDDLRFAFRYGMIGAAEPTANRPLYIRGNSIMAKEEGMLSESVVSSDRYGEVLIRKDSATKKESAANGSDNEGANDGEAESEKPSGAVQIRENLNETAFFYPALYADKNGDVKISFTLPESVTTWNFCGFAHDVQMNYGIIQSEAVASKKVMVMPNMPRFVRTGDKTTISARIANTTGKDIQTTAVMQMVDPATDKVVFSKSMKVKIGANSTESVKFYYSADGSNSLLVCRISAEGKDYSDGEQHYLPVLPNAERVINTVPFTFLGKGEKQISVSSLFPKDADDKKLTVEYTANPTWLMIQALPYMAEPVENNSVSLVASYYANVLGRFIMNQSPVIRKVVELWKKEDKGGDNSLMSALEKNQELKTLVLDETPWVMEAEKEGDMKKMLSSFFDDSMIDYRIESQRNALKALQLDNGSWTWFKGMQGSPAITGQVVETLVRLKAMTGDMTTKQMVNSAMNYLGGIAVKEYARIKEAQKKGEPVGICDDTAIQYLYVNALLGRQLPAAEKPMKDYLMNYLRNDRQRNIFAKARMAVVLQKDGKAQEAKEYVESIRQYTVSKPDMGRYFDTPRAGYSWFDYRIPTQTAAIEAIKAVEPDDSKTVSEMRLWLLQAKRTQAWDTPVNSVNAVYAFLDGNYSSLKTDGNDGISIALDGRNKALPTVSAGLGYVKTAFDIGKQQNLVISKSADGTSWGAVYAQFSQKAEAVTGNASGIKVEREIIPMGGKTGSLSVGDRVKVRITITADRDYDFVQVADKRAACMEPAEQTSGYRWGYYCSPKDNATYYYFDCLTKGKHVVETEYYIDRPGDYATGTCTAQCAYSPEFTGRTGAEKLSVGE